MGKKLKVYAGKTKYSYEPLDPKLSYSIEIGTILDRVWSLPEEREITPEDLRPGEPIVEWDIRREPYGLKRGLNVLTMVVRLDGDIIRMEKYRKLFLTGDTLTFTIPWEDFKI